MEQLSDQQLMEKRQNLQLLMDHIQKEVTSSSELPSVPSSSLQPSSPAVQCVVTRLLTEQQKLEVETMRRHVSQLLLVHTAARYDQGHGCNIGMSRNSFVWRRIEIE